LDYIVKPFDRSSLELNSTGANYTETSVMKSIKEQGKIAEGIQIAKKLRGQGCERILIFAPSIAASDYMARKLGVNSVSSVTDKKDRERYIKRFNTGLDWAICNVNVLSVGYDNQQIDAIIDLNPTMSLARYYQKLGRGVRVDLSDNPTKTDCVIVDLVGNYNMFGEIENLEIRYEEGWNIYSRNRQLTNMPFSKDNPIKELENNIMHVGEHKGIMFKDMPTMYLRYVRDTWDRNKYNEQLFRYIELVIK